LKALGVQVGSSNLKISDRQNHPIDTVLPGEIHDTPVGQTFIVEQRYPEETLHGNQVLHLPSSMPGIALGIREQSINHTKSDEICFLDTETSGLSGGTGTYAFLVGAGRFHNNHFHLVQFFMRDPSEEPAQLFALEQFLGACNILVSFNGKSFDVPLLNARYSLQGWHSPLKNLIQIDLLHLARKLWRNHLTSRTLGNIENEILGLNRSSDEVPGWMIPQLYFDYLRSGDARPMKNVFYHNAMDVLSMATLLNRIADLIANPLTIEEINTNEMAALGSVYEELGDSEVATKLYERSLDLSEKNEIYWDTLRKLSFLYKKEDKFPQALDLWEKAALNGYIYANVELAKYFEHRVSDYQMAMTWTEQAISSLESPLCTPSDRLTWLGELEYRLNRLKRKSDNSLDS